ncbi:hypothetical protein H7F33_14330 [Pedobacter sp. PAMC26386]|nr:hypothetical protein H7F33_14330 [Pedobacter sp. PAMC26386]
MWKFIYLLLLLLPLDLLAQQFEPVQDLIKRRTPWLTHKIIFKPLKNNNQKDRFELQSLGNKLAATSKLCLSFLDLLSESKVVVTFLIASKASCNSSAVKPRGRFLFHCVYQLSKKAISSSVQLPACFFCKSLSISSCCIIISKGRGAYLPHSKIKDEAGWP